MRLFLTCCVLSFSLTCHGPATAAPGGQDAVSADTQTQQKTEVQVYLAKIDHMLALAADGQYGRLKRGSEEKLEAERDRIESVLGSHTTVADLPPGDQLALQDAEDSIAAILQNKDKDRMICTRETQIGTRFSTKSCMTVSQREARAASGAEAVESAQRLTCVESATSQCGR